MKCVLSLVLVLTLGYWTSAQNDTIVRNDSLNTNDFPIYKGGSVGVMFNNPYSLKRKSGFNDFGLRFRKFRTIDSVGKYAYPLISDLFVGVEYSNTRLSDQQGQGDALQTFDSLVLLRKWEYSDTYWTVSVGGTFSPKVLEKLRFFDLEFFLNISHYTRRLNYGVDYLYFNATPSDSWYAQNNPTPTDFYGRSTSEYLMVGLGTLLRFEIPFVFKTSRRSGSYPVWYVGAKAGVQNLGIGFLLKDTIYSDPDFEFFQLQNQFHSNYVFRLSIARGLNLK